MPENPVSWPFTAVITQDGKALAEYKCSTTDSLIPVLRPYLKMPGVTVVITTAGKETRS